MLARAFLLRLLSVALALPFLLAPALGQEGAESAFRLVERGREVFQEDGREEEALEIFRRALEADPGSVDAAFDVAGTLAWLERHGEAMEVYAALMKKDRTSREAALGYAESALAIDDYGEVITTLSRFLRRNGDDPDALALRGEAYLYRGSNTRAVRDLRKAQDWEEMEESLPLLALALLSNAEHAEALEAALEGVEADESSAYAHHVHAMVLSALGSDVQAAGAQARAIELDPSFEGLDYEAYADVEDYAYGEPTEEELLEAYGLMFKGLIGWALLMGAIGLVVGLGGGRYLEPKEARSARDAERLRPEYDGPHQELLRIYLQNVAFTVLTLGIYRFWAKVRTRRFHYEHTRFADGRFDYHATGTEKFTGFLKGLVLLAPIGVGYYFGTEYVEERPDLPWRTVMVNYGLLFGFYLIRPLALVGSQRFNLARTSWNNLHFRFTGTLGGAYRLYARDLLFMVLTLGFYFPWHQRNVHEFKLQHTTLGEENMDFRGRGGELLSIQMVGVFFSMMTLGLFVPWWLAARKRYFIEGTRLMGRSFRSRLSGLAVLAVAGPGMLVSILTLGLGLPWAMTRWRKLLAVTTDYGGTIDAAKLTSIRDTAATSTLEGVGEAGDLIVDIGDIFGL